ncbi:MAG: hypothetical protein P8166_01835, partial [Candidatus Thiodiazotropha sp.]
ALSKLTVGLLQRRFDALLQAGTQRLKVTYLVAGLIESANVISCGQPLKDWQVLAADRPFQPL